MSASFPCRPSPPNEFKLDENLGTLGKALLEATGHDVMTVAQQSISGASDEHIYRIVCEERRVLVTLDRDFGEVLRFPPESSAGIIVLAIKGRVTREIIERRIADFLKVLRIEPIEGFLWIVEAGRVRIHQKRSDPSD